MSLDIVKIAGGAVAAEIVPEKGGICTRLTIGGEEILYLDPATLDEDRETKVRGGIPILFPNPGRLTDDTYKLGSESFFLPQHGFARNLPWSLVKADASSVELRLVSFHYTAEHFPFEFDIRVRYRCAGNTFTVEQTYANMGTQRPMPLHVGFHPYFLVPDADKAATTISTDAGRAWDNVAKAEREFAGFDLTADELDLMLRDHSSRETLITRPGKRVIRMTWDAPFSQLVVWTQKGKDFVCVEPWTAAPDALNTGEGLVHIGPRETRKTWFAITALE